MSAFYVDPECADGRRGRTMLGAMTDFGAKTAKTISRLDGGRLERGFRYGWNDGFQGNHKIPPMVAATPRREVRSLYRSVKFAKFASQNLLELLSGGELVRVASGCRGKTGRQPKLRAPCLLRGRDSYSTGRGNLLL